MKKINLLAIFSLLAILTQAQTNNLGINTTSPKATLDVTASGVATDADGILIPRVTKANLALKDAAYGTAQNGAMVFITDASATTTGLTAGINSTGFYYYNQPTTKWVAVGGTSSASSAAGATLQLVATNTNNAQILANANGSNTGDLVTFNNVVTTPTSGTYNTSTNAYTAAVAGLYFVQASTRAVDNATPGNTLGQFLYVDINGGGLASTDNILTQYPPATGGNFPSGSKGRGYTGVMLYLNAGDAITIKGLTANSAVAGTALKTDGSCKFMIVKMN